MNLLHPAELCILYVWVEAAITIEIVRARELNFFHSRRNESHIEPCGMVVCRWRNGYLLFLWFISPCIAAGGRWGANKKKDLHLISEGFTQKENFNC